MLTITDSSRRNDLFYYHEDVFVSEDSVWTGNTRHAAFTITEDTTCHPCKPVCQLQRNEGQP